MARIAIIGVGAIGGVLQDEALGQIVLDIIQTPLNKTVTALLQALAGG